MSRHLHEIKRRKQKRNLKEVPKTKTMKKGGEMQPLDPIDQQMLDWENEVADWKKNLKDQFFLGFSSDQWEKEMGNPNTWEEDICSQPSAFRKYDIEIKKLLKADLNSLRNELNSSIFPFSPITKKEKDNYQKEYNELLNMERKFLSLERRPATESKLLLLNKWRSNVTRRLNRKSNRKNCLDYTNENLSKQINDLEQIYDHLSLISQDIIRDEISPLFLDPNPDSQIDTLKSHPPEIVHNYVGSQEDSLKRHKKKFYSSVQTSDSLECKIRAIESFRENSAVSHSSATGLWCYKMIGKLIMEELVNGRFKEKTNWKETIKTYKESSIKEKINDTREKLINLKFKNASFQERKQLENQFWKLYSSHEAINMRNKIRSARQTYDRSHWKKNTTELITLLSRIRKMGPGFTQKEFDDPRDIFKNTLQCYPVAFAIASKRKGVMNFEISKRGAYTPDYDGLALSGRNEKEFFDTSFHEEGHKLEKAIPEILSIEKSYYYSRTVNHPLKWLGPGYRQDEQARDGTFIDPYMGKEYPQYRAFELVSMGFPMAYIEPERLWKDPDFAYLIYGILASAGKNFEKIPINDYHDLYSQLQPKTVGYLNMAKEQAQQASEMFLSLTPTIDAFFQQISVWDAQLITNSLLRLINLLNSEGNCIVGAFDAAKNINHIIEEKSTEESLLPGIRSLAEESQKPLCEIPCMAAKLTQATAELAVIATNALLAFDDFSTTTAAFCPSDLSEDIKNTLKTIVTTAKDLSSRIYLVAKATDKDGRYAAYVTAAKQDAAKASIALSTLAA